LENLIELHIIITRYTQMSFQWKIKCLTAN